MKKRGFTLIELLAVIVVLAIIALIATPIVMNVIKNANMGAAERSADNYVKAVETLIATEKLDGTPLVDGTYTIESDGTIKGNGEIYTVEVSGTKPVGGSIVIENGQVVKADTTIDYTDYTVKYPSGKAEASEKETNKIFTLADCDFVSGTEKTVGAKYTCDFGAGAKNFYILELGTNPVSNTTLESDEVALILEGNYDTTTQYWCDQNGANPSNNVCAADGLTAKLDEIASAWTELERDQIGLPSMEQIMVADGKSEDAYTDYPSLSNAWLYNWPDNADYALGENAPYGYWSSSPRVDYSGGAWYVGSSGIVFNLSVANGGSRGVRPVITLSI